MGAKHSLFLTDLVEQDLLNDHKDGNEQNGDITFFQETASQKASRDSHRDASMDNLELLQVILFPVSDAPQIPHHMLLAAEKTDVDCIDEGQYSKNKRNNLEGTHNGVVQGLLDGKIHIPSQSAKSNYPTTSTPPP